MLRTKRGKASRRNSVNLLATDGVIGVFFALVFFFFCFQIQGAGVYTTSPPHSTLYDSTSGIAPNERLEWCNRKAACLETRQGNIYMNTLRRKT